MQQMVAVDINETAGNIFISFELPEIYHFKATGNDSLEHCSCKTWPEPRALSSAVNLGNFEFLHLLVR